MLPEQKDLIIKNFVPLMQQCNVDILLQRLISKEVFSEKEINNIFSTDDGKHNKRIFFFALQKKDQTAFYHFIEVLKETGQSSLADILDPKPSGCVLFHLPDDDEEENEITSSIETEFNSQIPIDYSITPLTVEVKHSEEFYDTQKYNKGLDFYKCRSKKRGRVLIINNYDFPGTDLQYRKGAVVDQENLEQLFRQMGGWVVESHTNKTAEEMLVIIKDFATFKEEKKCDICFVIIMSHGHDLQNETVISGKDNRSIRTSKIQNQFTNDKCVLFRGKPKVFIYQTCRGYELDRSIQHTETDSASRQPDSQRVTSIRTIEDMLIGYATLLGYKAHRDPNRGTWYIELICEMFMKYSCDHSVDELLMMVDQGLRKRMSEKRTMQTSEQGNKGFKKLYLNPGIYEEGWRTKKFFENTS